MTVEQGSMTKDLALCISEGKPVSRKDYRSTGEFMADIKANFDKLLAGGSEKL